MVSYFVIKTVVVVDIVVVAEKEEAEEEEYMCVLKAIYNIHTQGNIMR